MLWARKEVAAFCEAGNSSLGKARTRERTKELRALKEADSNVVVEHDTKRQAIMKGREGIGKKMPIRVVKNKTTTRFKGVVHIVSRGEGRTRT